MTLSLPCTLKGRKGRYEVVSKLTEGGMSTIYVGKSKRGQAVIVKEASGVDLAQSEERLRIEAEILRTLSSPGHPRVVRYLDEGANLGPFCLVEEHLEGETLAERYKDKPADATTASRHILQLLEALSYLHARNVIHRDVKPKNIVLDPRREVVLIDFGAARDLEASVPRGLSDVVTKAMSFDPKERFPTAQDMAQAISGGPEESPGFPHLVVLGKKCKVKRAMEIGRDHKSCDQSCTKKGFGRPPEIGILDGERYLSKHHARILKDPKGRCWIEDLGSLNGTAMSHDGGRTYRQIRGFKREELTDGDVVALVYKPGRGPYMTIAFKGGRRRGGR